MKKTFSGLAVAGALGVTLVGCTGAPDLTPSGLIGNAAASGFAGYRAAPTVAAAGSPIFAASADLNGDGIPDLVSSNARPFFEGGDGSVSVSLAQAPGLFGEPTVFPLDAFLTGVVLGDFDEDGDIDIAAADLDGLYGFLLLNQGGGVFADPTTFLLDTDAPVGMVGGDFNEDGHLDLVATADSQDVTLLLGNGDGTFQGPDFIQTGLSAPFFVATADVDGDGHLDLGVTDDDGPDVAILLGDGNGGFDEIETRVSSAAKGDGGGFRARLRDGSFRNRTSQRTAIPVDSSQAGIVLDDLNGDNLVDVAVSLPFDSRVAVALNLGSGSFGEASSFSVEGEVPLGLASGDLDGDGDIDLATSNTYSFDVSILQGDGTGAFDVDTDPLNAGIEPFGLISADLDLDGLLDLVPSNEILSNLTVLLGQGSAGPLGTPVTGTGMRTDANPLAVGDLNGDGFDDLVVASGPDSGEPEAVGTDAEPEDVVVKLNLGNGDFGPPVPSAAGTGAHAIALGDLDGDGDRDVVLASAGTVVVMPNEGQGVLGAPVPFPVEADLTDIGLADLDGDGDLDAVVAAPGADAFAVLRNDGTGSFGQAEPVEVGTPIRFLAVRDLDGDGHPDVAGTGTAGAQPTAELVGEGSFLSVTLNDGSGGFGASLVTVVEMDEATGIAVGDVDGGDPEIAVCGFVDGESAPSGRYEVFRLQADQTLAALSDPLIEGRLPQGVALVDLNQDGRADLVGFDLLMSSVILRVATGNEANPFLPAFRYNAGAVPLRGTVGNFNNDGFPDFAVSCDGTGARKAARAGAEVAEGSAYVSILNSIVR